MQPRPEPGQQGQKKPGGVTRVSLEHANVALPAPAEYPGYHKFFPVYQEYRNDPLRHYILMSTIWRQSDQTSIDIAVTIAHSPRAVEQLVAELQRKLPGLTKGTLTGRPIGQRAWVTPKRNHIIIQDGYCLIGAMMTHPIRLGPGGQPGRAPLSPEEQRFFESHLIRTLDRLTALGFTSRPRRSASALAKRQVNERIAALERQKREQRSKQPPP